MKTLYLDCSMGAAGDMLTAALAELLPDTDRFIALMNRLGIPGVTFSREPSVKCGVSGTHITVTVHGQTEDASGDSYHHSSESGEHHHHHSGESGEHHHHHSDESGEHHHHHSDESGEHHHHHSDESGEHHHSSGSGEHHRRRHHRSLEDISAIVTGLRLPEKVQNDILAVYNLIAEAESYAHGVPVTEIHFHEVGTMDAIADVTAVCILMNELGPEEVVVSPVHVGKGHVLCEHGLLPVPAPATAYILRNMPSYSADIDGELCTPTGAALLKHFATRFGDMPDMEETATGYGMGQKDFDRPNCIRAVLGETREGTDMVTELACNVDDMTGEAVSFAMDRLFEAGALDVYTIPIGMKKSRPGIMIRVLCAPEDRDAMIALLFKHTTTIGVREIPMHRYVLKRKTETVPTPYGEVRRKDVEGYGTSRSKYEHDDMARIARENDMSLDDVKKEIEGTR